MVHDLDYFEQNYRNSSFERLKPKLTQVVSALIDTVPRTRIVDVLSLYSQLTEARTLEDLKAVRANIDRLKDELEIS